MFIAYRAAEAQVLKALRTDGFADLTLAQCRLAQRLRPAGIRITDLADEAGVTKQTAGGLLDELERNGYVTRHPDPVDARARLILLSERGQRLCAAAAAEVTAVETQWRRRLGAVAFAELREALLSLREITDPYR
ncbi:MarR family winged helix-turn-helix transcriptional regulator [Mycobacterium sp. WMMD1722]|uniref:MarR family winged helix-turn-helix transcriptional regulator n=1 Tax=Mycobacterium sp. WMMD1722 TaxID=3404117 RepID=UPI003BF60B47